MNTANAPNKYRYQGSFASKVESLIKNEITLIVGKNKALSDTILGATVFGMKLANQFQNGLRKFSTGV